MRLKMLTKGNPASIREANTTNGTFYYMDVGSETHGRRSYRLWIHKSIVGRFDEEVFPLHGVKIEKTPKGNLVLRPNKDYSVYHFFVSCGFRGSSDFKVIEPKNVEIFPYYTYSSPRGSTGISKGGLINVPTTAERLVIEWHRSGRLYGSPSSGVVVIDKEGNADAFNIELIFPNYQERFWRATTRKKREFLFIKTRKKREFLFIKS